MPLTYTLTSIKAAIQDAVEDDNADFVAALDDIVQKGETKLQLDIDADTFDSALDTATMTIGSPVIAKPAGLVAERSVRVTVSGTSTPVIRKSVAFVQEYNVGAANGTPVYYAEQGANFLVAPPPAGTYVLSVSGVYQPRTLVDDPTGSWASVQMPVLLFYAVKVMALDYLKKWSAKALAEAQYAALLDNYIGIKRKAKRTDIEDAVGNQRTDQQPPGPVESN